MFQKQVGLPSTTRRQAGILGPQTPDRHCGTLIDSLGNCPAFDGVERNWSRHSGSCPQGAGSTQLGSDNPTLSQAFAPEIVHFI